MIKIVTNMDGKLMSYAKMHEYGVEYTPGKWAEAHPDAAKAGFHLLVFSSLESMKDGKLPMDDCHEVWECEVEEKVPVPMWGFYSLCRCIRYGYKTLPPTKFDWPAGTVSYMRVKLTKRIQ